MYPLPYAALYSAVGPGTTVVDVRAQGDTDVGVVKLAPRGARLICTVLADDTGKPFDGLQFELCRVDRPDACTHGSTSLEEDGVWSVLVPAAPITVRIEEDGFEPCFIGNDEAADKETALGLEAGSTMRLVVRLRPKLGRDERPNAAATAPN